MKFFTSCAKYYPADKMLNKKNVQGWDKKQEVQFILQFAY